MDKQRNGHFQRFFFNAIYEHALKKEGRAGGKGEILTTFLNVQVFIFSQE